jgi:CubicO group peptidase (beta-lactamase class C family)
MALLRDAEVAWAGGFGVRRAGEATPVDERTVFEAASLSKAVFAYAVLKLCEERVLELDAPLTGYLGRRYIDDPQIDRVTVRHVLSHSSGLPNWRRGRPLSIAFPPGARYRYSGEGFYFLQQVIERLTAQPLETFMRERLLGPIGMRDSSYRWQERYARTAASGHDKEGAPQPRLDERLARFQKPGVEDPETATPAHNAAASLYTTAADFGRFVAHVMRPRGGRASQLSEPWIQAMLTPLVRVNETLSRGLGWGIETTELGTAFYHGGNNRYVLNFVLAYRGHGFGALCLTNGENGQRVYTGAIELAAGGTHPALVAG